jgi:hypothetical protein
MPRHAALSTVRRLIVFLLLFALVLIGTSGLGGLLERLFSSGAAPDGAFTRWFSESVQWWP